MEENNNHVRRPRRRGRRSAVPLQATGLFTTLLPAQPPHLTPQEELRILGMKVFMTLSATGWGVAAKEIRRAERGDTVLDEIAKQFWASVFEAFKQRVEYARNQL